jgi:hypothetical protein
MATLSEDQNARTTPPTNANGADSEPIELATEISAQGRTYKQVKRCGQVVLYELSVKGELRGFEVIVIQIHAAGERFGKWYPTRESMPSSESWGTSGFSYLACDRDGAERRFAELIGRAKGRADAIRTGFWRRLKQLQG